MDGDAKSYDLCRNDSRGTRHAYVVEQSGAVVELIDVADAET
ncbi:hypothetical protein ACFSL6_09725 [Paenibacillus thailandensis]|uniref:Glyoxalase n=1 Tax=Paenibacillus thailandensis TaxID=393250 RepID=A0ABW5R1N6_9BACL